MSPPPRIEILRLPDTLTDAKGVQGRRLRVRAQHSTSESASLDLPAIERDGAATGHTWVKPGSYVAEFDTTFLASGQRVNVVRIRDVPVVLADGSIELNDRHLLHAANRPRELTGCIAPGLRPFSEGVLDSRAAMDLLFRTLGGFERGRGLLVEVVDWGDRIVA